MAKKASAINLESPAFINQHLSWYARRACLSRQWRKQARSFVAR
jgi:hypothetical protein